MTLKAMEAHYNTLTDDDVIRMLRNTEGKTEFERGLILEAARRIEASAAAVQAEREACETILYSMAGGYRYVGSESMNKIAEAIEEAAAAIRARSGQEERKA